MPDYDTLSTAINAMRANGFTEDFNLAENCLICNGTRYMPEDFEITEVHRFEGPSDPADEAVLYGVESKGGVKGVLVNGYGYQSNPVTDAIARKLRIVSH